MILTVQQYRELSGEATVPPSDSDITLAINRYTALIEGFTGRRFSAMAVTESHYQVSGGAIQLGVFPVSSVSEVTADGEAYSAADYTLHRSAGILYHDGRFYGRTVVVTYVGGYQEAPYEVKVALSTLVQAFLAGSHGGVESLSPGRKEVVAGVGSIDYSSSASQLTIFGTPYAELGPYVSVLEKYREPGLA
jgi:hypothetical protein